MKTVINCINIDKTYDDNHYALKQFNLKVSAGELIYLNGVNGSGKSTLLRLLSRISLVTKGDIDIIGKTVSLIEGGAPFNQELSAKENIILVGLFYSCNLKNKVDEILSFCSLLPLKSERIKYFSSGMIKRLALATILFIPGDIYLLDEPFTFLDETFITLFIDKIQDLHQKHKTIIITTHNKDVLKNLPSRVIYV